MQDGVKVVKDGEQQIREGLQLMEQSEKLFRERFPDALLAD
jgi:hypothetical protein